MASYHYYYYNGLIVLRDTLSREHEIELNSNDSNEYQYFSLSFIPAVTSTPAALLKLTFW